MFANVCAPHVKPARPLRIVSIAVMCFLVQAGIAGADSPQTPHPQQGRLRIAIHCANKVLQLWRHTELIREYPIEVGKGGLSKKRGGDHRTPIGEYKISWMASRKSDAGLKIIEGRSWCSGNKFVYSDHGPALEKLWSDAYGGSEATVISINYPNEEESRKGYTGECIHIHAVKRPHDGLLRKSYGCIHMFAPDAMELYELVTVGTPVKILP
jgi:hypothetical protein